MSDEERPSAASMQRTKVQLATTYSPGTLFTFEGNLVVCESRPERSYPRLVLPRYATEQIFKAIEERVAAWYQQAKNTSAHTSAGMCVDSELLNQDYSGLAEPFPQNIFGFVEPEKLGYQPVLLTMICRTCKLVRAYESLDAFSRRLDELSVPQCPNPQGQLECEWRQTDIVFIHPNGNYRQPLPWRFDWDQEKASVVRREVFCAHCGSKEVRLNSESAQIGKRFFYCAVCGMRRNTQWIQNDVELLELHRDNSSDHLSEIRMKPISYRANSVHYPQQDMVIDFGDVGLLGVLSDQTNRKLIRFIANKFELPFTDPSLEEIQNSVVTNLGEEAWQNYQNSQQALSAFADLSETQKEQMKSLIEIAKKELENTLEEWRQKGIVNSQSDIPDGLQERIQNRQSLFASKFDPFRLLVEHEALRELVVNDSVLDSGMRSYTPLDDLDEHVGPADSEERAALNLQHREIMNRLGVSTIGLVRNFKTIHFSFGYSRVSPSPRTNYINDVLVPVRLKLFQRTMIDDTRLRPIYALRQDNEAIYVQLDEERVTNWLNRLYSNGLQSDYPIGLQYLNNVPEMGPFLEGLPGHDLDEPQLSLAVYSLLHTYAHHLIGAVSEYSGLSTGSLAEYIFPADLAFLIFRRGMTMDLGNMTAMLRNNAPAFLNYLSDTRNLVCGSGSLCLNRGGACPDCLMIPEVNCVTQNQLLSRSLLIGRGSPQKHGFAGLINGFLGSDSSHR